MSTSYLGTPACLAREVSPWRLLRGSSDSLDVGDGLCAKDSANFRLVEGSYFRSLNCDVIKNFTGSRFRGKSSVSNGGVPAPILPVVSGVRTLTILDVRSNDSTSLPANNTTLVVSDCLVEFDCFFVMVEVVVVKLASGTLLNEVVGTGVASPLIRTSASTSLESGSLVEFEFRFVVAGVLVVRLDSIVLLRN